MPRVLVVADDPEQHVVMNEWVGPEHVSDEHSAAQLIERLAWGVEDAARVERRRVRAFAPARVSQRAGASSYLDLRP